MKYLLVILIFTTTNSWAKTYKNICKEYAHKVVGCALAHYNHQGIGEIVQDYCIDLLKEQKKNLLTISERKKLKSEVEAINCQDIKKESDPFQALNIIYTANKKKDETVAYKFLKHRQHDYLKLENLKTCSLKRNRKNMIMSKSQICVAENKYAYDAAKEDLLIVFGTGFRHGITNFIEMYELIKQHTQKNFNAQIYIAESKFFDWRDVSRLHFKYPNIIRKYKKKFPQGKVALVGFSFGAAHFLKAMNLVFPRPEFRQHQMDLVILIDPKYRLSKKDEMLFTSIASKKVVNFSGIYKSGLTREKRKNNEEGTHPILCIGACDNYKMEFIIDPRTNEIATHLEVARAMQKSKDTDNDYYKKIIEILDNI